MWCAGVKFLIIVNHWIGLFNGRIQCSKYYMQGLKPMAAVQEMGISLKNIGQYD